MYGNIRVNTSAVGAAPAPCARCCRWRVIACGCRAGAEGEDVTVQSRPSWQVDPCPPWCAVDHGERDHPDDRVHRSATETVAVVARRTGFEGARIRRTAEATELDVALSRVDGDGQTWLYVGSGPAMAIEVSAESGRRLARAIGAVLEVDRA